MSDPQTASDSEAKGLSLPSHAIALCQDSVLAKVETSVLATPDLVIDYLPVDNHRALLRRWQSLNPVQQLMIGGLFGLALGASLMAWMTNARKVMTFAPSAVNNVQTAGLSRATLNTLHHRIGSSIQPAEVPGVAIPVSEVQPFLRPVMMDRFYLPAAAVPGHADAPPSAIVVDRFYFAPQTFSSRQVAGVQTDMEPGNPMESSPLMVPLPPPPPSPQAVPMAQIAATSNPPPSPSLAPLPPATMPTVAPAPKVNRLIGVVKTGQFSAALVQTDQNAYAVKLGDMISQSTWQLIEVQDNSVILGNGHERLTIHVGDMF